VGESKGPGFGPVFFRQRQHDYVMTCLIVIVAIGSIAD
jgi:hypothetical protein